MATDSLTVAIKKILALLPRLLFSPRMDQHIPPDYLDALRSQPDVLIALLQKQALQIQQQSLQIAQLARDNSLLSNERDTFLNDNTSLLFQLHALRERLRKLEEQNHPPAAPFRRKRNDSPAKPPGKPGARPGHKPHWKHTPEHVDEKIEAPLAPLCPHCQSALEAIEPRVQHIEDIVARKHVTRLLTHQGFCPKCDCVIASTHPRQVSWATGAAGTHLGPRALATACMLKHQMGLSLAKTCETLRALCGISITPGGLAQIFQRMAAKLEGDYEALRARVLASPSVHTDETSWYVAKPGPSLCVYCTPSATLYRVVEHKDRETLHETIPPDYPGVLVSDCLSVYDNATPLQQKCYAHHLRAISRAVEQGADEKPGSFLDMCRQLLRGAMKLKEKGWEKRAPPEREQELRVLKLAAKALLENPRIDEPLEEAVRLRLQKQIDHLFVFLEVPGVEPTNNLAERQLRPAVIARKISCGQRTWKGAQAWQVHASLAASARQTGADFIDLVASRCSFATS
jgi:transposase